MALIEIASGSDADRDRLSGMFKNLGMETVSASGIEDAVTVAEKTRPRAVFLAENPEGAPVEVFIREILRVAPLVPVVVCLNERNASRAVELMKEGAFDCVASPWTEGTLRPVVRKALRISGTGLDLSKSPVPVWKIAAAAAAAVVFAALAFVLGYFSAWEISRPRPKPPETAWKLPYGHPSGIAFHDDKIWISDWYTQAVYVHAPPDMRITRVAYLPSVVPSGLCIGGGNIWVASASGYIEKRMINEKLTLLSKYKFQGSGISGICHDGLYLWTADGREGKIRRHLIDDELSVDKTFVYPKGEVSALACGGEFIWTADSRSGEIVSYNMKDPETAVSRNQLPDYRAGGLKITGLAWDGKRFWSSAEGKDGGNVFQH